jgi:hypothetical protein
MVVERTDEASSYCCIGFHDRWNGEQRVKLLMMDEGSVRLMLLWLVGSAQLASALQGNASLFPTTEFRALARGAINICIERVSSNSTLQLHNNGKSSNSKRRPALYRLRTSQCFWRPPTMI